MSETPKAHTRKPEPSEPWRYVCPDCDSQVNGEADRLDYRCASCRRSLERRDLVDKKSDRYEEVMGDYA